MKNLNKTLEILILVAAWTVALSSLAYKHLSAWWEENGEKVQSYIPVIRKSAIIVADILVSAAIAVYNAGVAAPKVMNRNADRLYFAAIGF